MTDRGSQENRRHKRHVVACPVTLYCDDADIPATVAIGDVSDGGVYLAVPVSHAPAVSSDVDVTFCVPRKPGGLECFSAGATVVRSEAGPDEASSGIAIQFKKPIRLKLS